MDWSLLFKFATQRVLRFGVIVGIILLIWHVTLIGSAIPHINNPISWITTILSPFFAFCGFNVIYYIYKKWNYKGEGMDAVGTPVVGFDGEGCIAIIVLLLFVALLPVIAFYIPVEALFGILYYKQTLWQELQHSWDTLTLKEGMFVITKAVFLLSAISFIFWEIVIHIGYGIYSLGKWALAGKNKTLD